MSDSVGAHELSFSELVFSDLQRYRPGERGWLRVLLRCLVIPGMIASVILRAQQCLVRRGQHSAANVLLLTDVAVLPLSGFRR